MADEDFDKLCESFEDGENTVPVVKDADYTTDDILGEIDSFLEGSPSPLKLATSDGSSKRKSNSPESPVSVGNSVTENIDQVAKYWSVIEPSLKKLSNDQSRPVENDIDISVLDKEDWEDEFELKEFRLSEIVLELREELLDDEDEASLIPLESKTLVPDRVYELNTTKKLNNLERITKDRYYVSLETVWRKYEGEDGVDPMPCRENMTQPRIFKHQGRVVGYESLQEYVDNNHPLWGPHRKIFNEFLDSGDDQRLKEFVSNSWGNQGADPLRNLTAFRPRGQSTNRENSKVVDNFKGMKKVQSVSKKDEIKNIKQVLVDMYANSENNEGVQQTEEARIKKYETLLKSKLSSLAEAENDEHVVSCDVCVGVCLCRIGHNIYANELSGRSFKMSESQCEDMILRNIPSNSNDDTVALKRLGVKQAYELISCYSQEPCIPHEYAVELASMEDIHDSIMDMYDSPYYNKWGQEMLEEY